MCHIVVYSHIAMYVHTYVHIILILDTVCIQYNIRSVILWSILTCVCLTAEAGRSQRGQFAEVIQLLIQVGCDVNAVDDQYGRTSGHWAVFYHKEDILMELLIAGEWRGSIDGIVDS